MDRQLKTLRRRCETRLRKLNLPIPFDLQLFCAAFAMERSRPITLRPIRTGEGPVGLWAAGERADYIFFEEATSRFHQDHIVLHELCHIICQHHPTSLGDVPMAERLFRDIHPETIRLLLKRTAYTEDEEREAELLASMILERVGRGSPPIPSTLDFETLWLRDRIAGARDGKSEKP